VSKGKKAMTFLLTMIMTILGLIRPLLRLPYNEEPQDDNLNEIKSQIAEAQLFLLKSPQEGDPGRPFGIEKKEFDKTKRKIEKAFAKILLEKYKVS
jgi:hypothetical protein